jgi:hypothetical protein
LRARRSAGWSPVGSQSGACEGSLADITWSAIPGQRPRAASLNWAGATCFRPEYVVYMMGTGLNSMWFPLVGWAIQRLQMAVFAGFAATFTARIS